MCPFTGGENTAEKQRRMGKTLRPAGEKQHWLHYWPYKKLYTAGIILLMSRGMIR